MAFVRRRLRATFQLQQGAFTNSGTNKTTLQGLRMSARITNAGGLSTSQMSLDIWGMTLSMMKQLSTLGIVISLVPRNLVTLEAGDDDKGMAVVFQGNITDAFADFQAAPEVPFRMQAQTLAAAGVAPAPPTSYRGPVDVATVMNSLATQMNLRFENNGVTTKLPSSYFPGSAREQMIAVVKAARIGCNMGNDGILAIWPYYGSRGGQVPLVSPQTGMIGYPAFTAQGIAIRTVFNPSISFGSKIKVDSSILDSKGTWAVWGLDHDLESLLPGGQWFSSMRCYNPDFQPPVLRP